MIRLRRDPNPRVSVMVVAFNRRDRLERCLLSLSARIGRSIAVETVVVSNGIGRDIDEFLNTRVTGATLISSDVNLGFGGACNLARSHARGSLLALLNDDAEIEDGWLEHLVASADAHPHAGAVGSAILFPDGRLQEAGSIIWDDGSTLGIGRGTPGLPLEHDFVREVDYCSACSLLVRSRTWDAVGGMDVDYFPAYYEDTDLCLRIRRLGEQILFAPGSRVRHHEGSSSDHHFRDFLIRRNRVRLKAMWKRELAEQEPANPQSPAAIERALHRARRHARRLLIIDDRIPDPAIGSGFSRMLEVVLAVTPDHAVSLWCSAEAGATNDTLRDLGVRVVPGPLEAHLATPEVLYDAVLISRPQNFVACADAVRRYQPHAALVYDAEALYHRRLAHELALERDLPVAESLRSTLRSTYEVEAGIRTRVQAIAAVTEAEAAYFASTRGDCPITVIRPQLPWAKLTARDFHARADVIFVAGWLAGSRSPNADGLKWFVGSVWPKVRTAVPGVRLKITGNAPPAVRQSIVDGAVEFTGLVPDLFDIYDSSRVAIAPLRYGAGLSIKVLEALRFGVPVVTTAIAGPDLDRLARDAVWMADSASGFAEGVVTLLTDAGEWQRRRRAMIRAGLESSASARSQWRTLIDQAQLARSGHVGA
jgi:GT2 family glycosyltransferase/glycosyltransferase involved in cell wall biosynthesis